MTQRIHNNSTHTPNSLPADIPPVYPANRYPPPGYAPEQRAPEQRAPEQYGPEQYGPADYRPDGYGAYAGYGYEQRPLRVPSDTSVPPPAENVDRVGLLLREVLQITLPAIVLAIVVHLFLAQATVVYGQSMEPNLSSQQRLIVDKFSLHFNAPARNDIVVIDLPSMDDMLVKRVVGLPGEVVEVRDGVVLVDGAPLAEPYDHDLGHTSMAPVTLAPLEYFVMGDNRDNSNDSRAFGPVHRTMIVGRVWLRYWPLNEFHFF